MSNTKQDDIEITEDPKFTEGFNNGWIIATHTPEISKIVVGSLKQVEKQEDMYLEGVQEGILHHELEKIKERNRNYQLPDGYIPPNKNKDKGRSKD